MGPPVSIGNNITPGPSVIIEDILNMGPWGSYKTIDKTPLGGIKWQSFSVQYNGERPETDIPPWMDQDFDVWYRDPRDVVHNMLANPDYAGELDYRPYHEFSTDGDECQWKDFMSSDWAWAQADIISEDPESHGSTFVPVILGSDKTTVSVATGNNKYYPLYASIVSIIGFLAIPKTTKEHATSNVNHQFGDGHFCRVIYGLGPYIADYEEQVLLTCIMRGWCPRCLSSHVNLDEPAGWHCRHHTDMLVEEGTLGALWDEYGIVGDLVPFTNDFARANIHELITPDILHQLIKGTFKDHLVDWIERYLYQTHSKKEVECIMDDIDQRITAVPAFAGLRRFPQGRGFKQWTGNDSKALMKVFFFMYTYPPLREKTIQKIQKALDHFHQYRKVFEALDVVSTFSLPRQHSLQHYVLLIQLFGAPNSLCSSITEAKHIKAVKEPWRRSSQYKALGQMLVTNQRLNKLAASCADFTQCKMLDGTILSTAALEVEQLHTLDLMAPDEQVHLFANTEAVDSTVDDNDNEIDDGPTNIKAHVKLAKMPHIVTNLQFVDPKLL
ncbi:hypothetical protein F4604DRAFT_1682781 [Suillus subluteus]|nr:hypothetical protein F4604DRAFT_1682781 [Suillus subluteus]